MSNNSHDRDDHEQLQDSLILSHSIDQGSSLFHRKVSKPSISELPSSSDFQNHSNINHDSENKQDKCQENKEETVSTVSTSISSFFVFACCFILSLLFYSLPNGMGILILFIILLGLFFYKKSFTVPPYYRMPSTYSTITTNHIITILGRTANVKKVL